MDITATQRRITTADIIRSTAVIFDVPEAEITSARQFARVVLPRQVVMHLAKMLTFDSNSVIANQLGLVDATNVGHADQKIDALKMTDNALAEKLERITQHMAQSQKPDLDLPINSTVTDMCDIKVKVAHHYSLTVADLVSDQTSRHIARARQVAMYLASIHLPLTFNVIGQQLGSRDHPTVRHGIQRIEILKLKDPQLAHDLHVLAAKLPQNPPLIVRRPGQKSPSPMVPEI